MNYGLYLSAAGTLASLHRQDVLTNNLANINTPAFKPDVVDMRARLPERLESGGPGDPQLLLEQLGGGVLPDCTRFDLRQAHLDETNSDLDFAIQGNGFFVVSAGKTNGRGDLRLTRDGRFTLNANGELVTASSGLRVLDVNDQPIHLNPASHIHVESDGRIFQDEQEIAQVQTANVADQLSLTKTGDNLFRFAGKRVAANGSIKQGRLEASAVDPVLALNDLINASKAVQTGALMMQYQDQILGQAINTFGRVA